MGATQERDSDVGIETGHMLPVRGNPIRLFQAGSANPECPDVPPISRGEHIGLRLPDDLNDPGLDSSGFALRVAVASRTVFNVVGRDADAPRDQGEPSTSQWISTRASQPGFKAACEALGGGLLPSKPRRGGSVLRNAAC